MQDNRKETLARLTAHLDQGHQPPESAGLFGADIPEELAALVVLSAPWDVTASGSKGQAKAPAAIKLASHELDLWDHSFGPAYQKGIALLNDDEILARNSQLSPVYFQVVQAIAEGLDLGSLSRELAEINDAGNWLFQRVADNCRKQLNAGRKVAVLGGDHSVSLGAITAFAEQEAGLSILHIDAHHDLREGYQGCWHSHASIFYHALTKTDAQQLQSVVSVGVRDYSAAERAFATEEKRLTTFYGADLFAKEAEGVCWAEQVKRILEPLTERVYISLDIDGLCPTFCPGTGTPVPGGLSYDQAVYLIEQVVKSGRDLVGFDLVEVNPVSDYDSNVGARLLYKMAAASLWER